MTIIKLLPLSVGGLLNSLFLLEDGCKEDTIVFGFVVPSVVVDITVEDGFVEALGEDVNTVVVIVIVVVASVVDNFAVEDGCNEPFGEGVTAVAVEDVVEAVAVVVVVVVIVVVDNSFWTDSI